MFCNAAWKRAVTRPPITAATKNLGLIGPKRAVLRNVCFLTVQLVSGSLTDIYEDGK